MSNVESKAVDELNALSLSINDEAENLHDKVDDILEEFLIDRGFPRLAEAFKNTRNAIHLWYDGGDI